MRRNAGLLMVLQLLAWQGLVCSHAKPDAYDDVRHVDNCNYCQECIPSQTVHASIGASHQSSASHHVTADGSNTISDAAAKPEVPGALRAQQVQVDLIGPNDHQQKLEKPNCTLCHGCTTVLTDLYMHPVEFNGMSFTHGKGATNGWLLYGQPMGSNKKYIVKVSKRLQAFTRARDAHVASYGFYPAPTHARTNANVVLIGHSSCMFGQRRACTSGVLQVYCMPYSKVHGKPQACPRDVFTARMRLALAHVQLAEECGAPGITPRVWVAPVNGLIPNMTFLGTPHAGYHVRWYGLWMEEAPGITLHALHAANVNYVMYHMLTNKMNKTQVVQQTVLDLLTAQCDRHSENVFMQEDGTLAFIDNDRSLGMVRCGGDSVLLPGSRYHTQLRLGYWGSAYQYYKMHAHKPSFCTGPVDMRVVMDYRCVVPDGKLGTQHYPAGMRECLASLMGSSVEQIMARYGFRDRKPALILRRRSRDLLTEGFEWTLTNGLPRNGPKQTYTPQPPCCSLVFDARSGAKCSHCWQPVLEVEHEPLPKAARNSTAAEAEDRELEGA